MKRSFRLPFRSRSRIAAEVDEELAFHLEEMARRLCDDGWSPSDAAAEARRRFGDIEYTRDYCRTEDFVREERRDRMTIVDELVQDLRYAARTMRSSVGFTLVAVATLALGIGANTAIFSVVRAVLLEPLPFVASDRTVRFWNSNPGSQIVEGEFSEPDFLDIKAGSKFAESIGGFSYDGTSTTGVDLTGTGSPERLSAVLVTPGFFETLRPNPLIGRAFAPDEQIAGRDKFVVLGYGLWQRRFGGDATIVGRPITLNGDAYTVVGVMRPEFSYPAPQSVDVWIPLSNFGPDMIGRARPVHFLSAIARLKPGVSLEQFHAEASGIAARLARTYPDNPGWTSAAVKPIRESIVGAVRRPLLILSAAVAMVLLITCVNIASLLLARASARSRELAVRAALGAGRARIVRQLVTESLVLALAGGVLGALLGYLAVRTLSAQSALQLPGAVKVDGFVLAFTLGIAVVCGLVFGALPAFRAAGLVLEQSLRNGGRGAVGHSGQRVRGILVVTEVALAVILAAGASLATKSFSRLVSVDPGFQPSNALVVRLAIGGPYDQGDRLRNYYLQVLDAVRRVPGVTAAGSIRDLPTRGNGEALLPENLGLPAARPGEKGQLHLHHISPDFFKAMGVPLRAGREFTVRDKPGWPVVLLVNEAAARRFWPGENPVGKTLRAGKTEIGIVGLVGDIRQRGLSEPAEPAIYISALQNMRVGMSIVARTTGDPLRLANAVRNAIWSVDRNQPIAEVTTLDAVLGSAVARPRLLAWLLSAFGFVGLILGVLGLYGLLAFLVAQRRQEIGVRAALGAPPLAVIRLVMGHGMALAAGGIVAGVLVASLLTRQMQSVLFDIAPNDIGTFVQVVVVLVATALFASWLPARRALAINPVTALRSE